MYNIDRLHFLLVRARHATVAARAAFCCPERERRAAFRALALGAPPAVALAQREDEAAGRKRDRARGWSHAARGAR